MKPFCSCFKRTILNYLFVLLFVYISSGGEVEDYTKCELIGGGSPIHLYTFSNLFIAAVHYSQISTCYVSLLLLTTPI